MLVLYQNAAPIGAAFCSDKPIACHCGHESTAMTRHYYYENIAALKSAVAAIPTL